MCYSLWYNAPTMLPAGGRQHRAASGKSRTNFHKILAQHVVNAEISPLTRSCANRVTTRKLS